MITTHTPRLEITTTLPLILNLPPTSLIQHRLDKETLSKLLGSLGLNSNRVNFYQTKPDENLFGTGNYFNGIFLFESHLRRLMGPNVRDRNLNITRQVIEDKHRLIREIPILYYVDNSNIESDLFHEVKRGLYHEGYCEKYLREHFHYPFIINGHKLNETNEERDLENEKKVNEWLEQIRITKGIKIGFDQCTI